MTGKEATTAIGIEYGSNLLPKTRKNVAIKATIIAPIDMKSVVSPIINLLGNDQRKFCSAYREVRIDKKEYLLNKAENGKVFIYPVL
ncbi:hypothetical protein NC651_015361 [Populus alba x Populus x berolinensis]|nr:hypothetical protein NC651_015361 [Populus alba x Populus x berolinensis]